MNFAQDPFSEPGFNPYASPQAPVTAEGSSSRTARPRRPYPPVVCQLAFVLDLPLSLVMLSFVIYEMVVGAPLAVQGPEVILAGAWFSALVADWLGLMSRRGVWLWGTVAFGSYWVHWFVRLVLWSLGSEDASQDWLAQLPQLAQLFSSRVQLVTTVLWYGAVVLYRFWYIEQKLRGRLP